MKLQAAISLDLIRNPILSFFIQLTHADMDVIFLKIYHTFGSKTQQKNRRERQNRYLEHTNRNVLNSHFHGFVQAFQQKVLF
jgi:hypothetical protein